MGEFGGERWRERRGSETYVPKIVSYNEYELSVQGRGDSERKKRTLKGGIIFFFLISYEHCACQYV